MTHPWSVIKARRTDRLIRKYRPVGTPSYWYLDDVSRLDVFVLMINRQVAPKISAGRYTKLLANGPVKQSTAH